MLIVFVESYGRVALEDPERSPGVVATMDAGTRQLEAAGFESRSAYLTSPTFGALSWLAHATLQSGLWIDSQPRYDVLVTSPRLTLTRLFGEAGWRTVKAVPANNRAWPQGEFYGFDHVYDSRNIGYEGPRFGYPTMPDQYTLDAIHRLELAPQPRRPVMAEIDLITSHAPWSRVPRLIGQADVGDGAVFEGMPQTLASEADIWPDRDRVRQAYFRAVDLLAAGVHPVPDDVRRRRPRGDPAGRPPARHDRVGLRRRARRTGLLDRPGPGGPGRPRPGDGGRACGPARRAGLADGRLPRPFRRDLLPSTGQTGTDRPQ